MRTLSLALAFVFLSAAAYAQNPTCKANAAEKKLAGAALNELHEEVRK